METIDFIDFMSFEEKKNGGKKIAKNQCSVLINNKNNSYYFRFQKMGFNYLKVGKLNGRICFVLNNQDGVKGQDHTNSGTIAFTGKNMVETIVKIIKHDANMNIFKCRLNLDLIKEDENSVIFVFNSIN